ncbi:hypothetical protein COLO4_10341 [Corchorus olitorius]|uniref:Uncharacterized protein n=1 Tax=Corchorus olitorius TaxID=93759 RepID=A0A1R3K902_9ROSI|nr:hypothetical protein COLO4_10341 [Corchorus olitorius]
MALSEMHLIAFTITTGICIYQHSQGVEHDRVDHSVVRDAFE